MNELELFYAEVSDQCTPEQARELTDRIKLVLDGIWELVKTAYTSRAWAALGYASWDEYCTREFGTSRLRLPREERGEVTSSLRDAGLSLRAIASATGQSEATVRRDLAGASNDAPEVAAAAGVADPVEPPAGAGFSPPAAPPTPPLRTRGVDGKSYQAARTMPPVVPSPAKPAPPLFPAAGEEVVDAEIVDDAPPPLGPSLDEAAARALRSFVEADPAQHVAAWRTAFIAAIARTTSIIPSFKPEAVAENADEALIKELRDAHRHLGNYIDRIDAQRPTGLRLVRRG